MKNHLLSHIYPISFFFLAITSIAHGQVPIAYVDKITGGATVTVDGLSRRIAEGHSLFRSSEVAFDKPCVDFMLVEWDVSAGQYGDPVTGDNGETLHKIKKWKKYPNVSKKAAAIERDVKRMLYHAGRTRGGENLLYSPANGAAVDLKEASS